MTLRRARVGEPDVTRRTGDPADVTVRLAAHRDAVEQVCRARLRSRVDADEVARQVVDDAAADPAAVPEDRLVGGWLVRRAERACLQRIRDGARPRGVTVDVARPAALTPPAEELVRRTLAVLDARQAQARSLRDALVPGTAARAHQPGATVPTTRTARPRRRLLPAAGIGGVGLLPAVLAPAIAVATVVALMLPALRPAADPPPPPPPITDGAASELVAPLDPVRQTADVDRPTGPTATGIEQALRSLGDPAGPRAAGSPSPQGPSVMIGGMAGPRVVIDDQDPQDDDVTIGFEELIGIGAGLDDVLQQLDDVLEDPAAIGGPEAAGPG